MAKAHERIVEIVMTTANGAQTVVASAVNYFRDRGKLIANAPYVQAATFPAASASPYEIPLGEALPPASILRLKVTINA